MIGIEARVAAWRLVVVPPVRYVIQGVGPRVGMHVSRRGWRRARGITAGVSDGLTRFRE